MERPVTQTTPKTPHIVEWLEQIKGYIGRCKDTEWSDEDENNLLFVKTITSELGDENGLGPTALNQAYQELFDYLCRLEKPPVRSEMDDIIFLIKRWWTE